MVITINTVSLGYNENQERFILDFFLYLARSSPNDSFNFLIDAHKNIPGSVANTNFIILNPTSKPNVFSWFSFQMKLAALIKKNKTDILISPYIISKLLIKIPQIQWLPHLAFGVNDITLEKKEKLFFKKYIIPSIKTADGFFTSSIIWKDLLQQSFSIADKKIQIINNIYSINNSSIEVDVQNIKNIFFDNCEYFLVDDDSINSKSFIFILKSFSLFKKRLKSTMKLAFNVPLELKNEFSVLINAYKYRSDIIFIESNNPNDIAKYFAASYAVIVNQYYTGFLTSTIQALVSKTAILAVKSPYNMAGSLAVYNPFYFEKENINELSDCMIKIYKDENGRKERINDQVSIAANINPITMVTDAKNLIHMIYSNK